MITIKYNNEIYEITRNTRYGDEGIAFADYKSSIDDHVENIIGILVRCNIEHTVEEL